MPRDLLSGLWAASAPPPLTPRDWELLLAQARACRLQARLAERWTLPGWAAALPPAPAHHLQSARRFADRLRYEVLWEADHLLAALRQLPTPIVLLKGAAYLAAGLPPGRARLFADVDIMVRRDQLPAVELALFAAGWIPEKLEPYDDRYYRRWMHELPPLQHVQRRTALDVHHTIAPPTSRFAIDGEALLAACVPLGSERPQADDIRRPPPKGNEKTWDGPAFSQECPQADDIRRPPPEGDEKTWDGPAFSQEPRLSVLAPVDMVLHSAVHLLQEGEFGNGLRDLLDLDDLLNHFSAADAGFWRALLQRARALGAGVPLAHALAQVDRLFGTRPPPRLAGELAALAPNAVGRWLMGRLLAIALRPDHASCGSVSTWPARKLLYMRSHWLRMPWYQIAPHLLRKAWMRAAAARRREPAAPPARAEALPAPPAEAVAAFEDERPAGKGA